MQQSVNSAKLTIQFAISAVFAALVCVATIAFTVSVPATTGYFNVGETLIYLTALLFGPYVGAFAGGVGAAIADMLVAPQFAPGTFVIKSFEGAIVGFLNRKLFKQTSKRAWKIFTILLGTIVGVLLAITGAIYYSGNVELYMGYPPPQNPTFSMFVPSEFWYLLGGISALLIILMGLKIEPEFGRSIFAIVIGGLEMVCGYFLYEQLVLSKPAAIVEVPINIGQMLVGLIVAIPIMKIVLRSLPQLKS
ncbi:MAG: ECF transporter S component [Candidatus Bathyarchaeia archaeon]